MNIEGKMPLIITLTTDFGASSPYVAQMKGAMLSISPVANIVDVAHSIRPQNVLEGAIVLTDTAWHFPVGTIHVAVVDPGVGSERAIVAALVEGHWFIAPDNGLLTGVVEGREVSELRTVSNTSLWREDISRTFHGRDIMGPVAAHLSLGAKCEEIGPPCERIEMLDWPVATMTECSLTGQVVFVDSFGNLITNIHRPQFDAWSAGKACTVSVDKQTIGAISQTYADYPSGSAIALFSSSDRLEVAVVNGNASESLVLEIGSIVRIEFDGSGP